MTSRRARSQTRNRWRTSVLALAAVAAVVAVSPAAGSLRVPAAARIQCDPGAVSGVVDGKFTCLAVGRPCAVVFQADYVRSGLWCKAGKLRKRRPWPLASSGAGTRANPVPLGESGSLGNGWLLSVTRARLDATSDLVGADDTNEPPPSGFQYVLVAVTATYLGPGGSHLNSASTLKAADAHGGVYTSFNSNCGVLPAPNLDLKNPLVFRGGTIAGYAVCWRVPASEAATLVMYFQPPLANRRTWFALR